MVSPKINDAKYVAGQYRTDVNIQKRISLHERFSLNKYGWHRWVFDQLIIRPGSKILELGCGPANLWQENLDRLPSNCEILLTDFSEGMVEKAKQNLGESGLFQYQVLDAQKTPLPFENGQLDVIIANHMLYHLSARQAALAEIRRILKPDGAFYASTVGERHLWEITELIHRFDPALTAWGNVADSFKLENGTAQLANWFLKVSLVRYEDSLEVTEAATLVDYILSGWMDLSPDRCQKFSRLVESELAQRGGVYPITKDSGLFIAIC